MTDVALFDLVELEPEWTPIRHAPIDWPDKGLAGSLTGNGGFTKETWKAWCDAHPNLCRDCGARIKSVNHGSSDGDVCDDCAEIDGCRIRPHNVVVGPGEIAWMTVPTTAQCTICTWFTTDRDGDPEIAAAEHVRPRHTSHWGIAHEIEDHDRLVAARTKRRARYLKAKDSES